MTKSSALSSNDSPIGRFARFFKGYGLSLSLIVATLPIFVSSFDLLPLFATTKNIITIITSVGPYLLVGFIFSQRHGLAAVYFPGRVIGNKRIAYSKELEMMSFFNILPLLFAFLMVILFVWFIRTVDGAVEDIAYENAVEVSTANIQQPVFIRDKIDSESTSGTTQARLQAFGLDKIIRIIYKLDFCKTRIGYHILRLNDWSLPNIWGQNPNLQKFSIKSVSRMKERRKSLVTLSSF